MGVGIGILLGDFLGWMVEFADVDARELTRLFQELRKLLKQQLLMILMILDLALKRRQQVCLFLVDAFESLRASKTYRQLVALDALGSVELLGVYFLDGLLLFDFCSLSVVFGVVEQPMCEERHRFLRLLLIELREALGNDLTDPIVLEVLHVQRVGSLRHRS